MPNLYAQLKKYDVDYNSDVHDAIKQVSNDCVSSLIKNVINNKDIKMLQNKIVTNLKEINIYSEIINGKAIPTFNNDNNLNKSDLIKLKINFEKNIQKEIFNYGYGKKHWQQFYAFAKKHPEFVSDKDLQAIFSCKQLLTTSAFDIFIDIYKTKLNSFSNVFGKHFTNFKYIDLDEMINLVNKEKIKAEEQTSYALNKKNKLKEQTEKLFENFVGLINDIKSHYFNEINSDVKKFLASEKSANISEQKKLFNDYDNFISFNNDLVAKNYNSKLIGTDKIYMDFYKEIKNISNKDTNVISMILQK